MQFLFAGHTLDADRRERRRGARPIAVKRQLFDLLADLVQNRDHAMSATRYGLTVFAGNEGMYDPERKARESVEVSVTRRNLKKNSAR